VPAPGTVCDNIVPQGLAFRAIGVGDWWIGFVAYMAGVFDGGGGRGGGFVTGIAVWVFAPLGSAQG
jgi:hypothetical protein